MDLSQLYKDAGIAVNSFKGVPVFQAEGLTVKTEQNRYTPLFFSKDDLDAAVQNAAKQREQQQEEATAVKAARADEDLEAAQQAVRPPFSNWSFIYSLIYPVVD
jgi:hypothetical protein